MENVIAHLKKEWKMYGIGIWMLAVSGLLLYVNAQVGNLRQTSLKLASDVDSIESILISTDSNVAHIKKQVDHISARVAVIQKRVKRR